MNANKFDSKANIKLNKNGIYNNKNNFSVLKERFGADFTQELLLEVVPTDRSYNDNPIFELVKFKATVQEAPAFEQEEE